MTLTTEAAIADALISRLSSLVLTPPLPVAYPGVAFVPPADTGGAAEPYLDVVFLPNRTETLHVGAGSVRHMGFLQVAVVWPVGQGVIVALDVAGRVIDWFSKGTKIEGTGVRLTIIEQPWTAPPLQDVSSLRIPVSIPYVAFVAAG